MKTKKERNNKEDSIKNLQVNAPEVEPENEIIKTVYYNLKPITPEDAMLKLQERPTDKFVTFINSETNKVNVLFRLKDSKNFGIVEPDVYMGKNIFWVSRRTESSAPTIYLI